MAELERKYSADEESDKKQDITINVIRTKQQPNPDELRTYEDILKEREELRKSVNKRDSPKPDEKDSEDDDWIGDYID